MSGKLDGRRIAFDRGDQLPVDGVARAREAGA